MISPGNQARFQKIVVIGWDGADWRLLGPWIAAGKLPTLARLVAEGAHGNLRSTIRPESSVAWASFSTGVNPGKHGIFGFANRVQANSYETPLTNASSVRAIRFWDVLGRDRYKTGLLNIPYTYPPSPVNGYLVGGMLTPSAESDFTFPSALKKELIEEFGGYTTDVTGPQDDKAHLVENVRSFTTQQTSMALYLLRNKPWDFFNVVFVGPDRLQHFLWADTDTTHPQHDRSTHFSTELLAHYQDLDSALSLILQDLPADTLVLLISDHGFNGCSRKFFVNHWLHSKGLLALTYTSEIWTKATNLLNLLHRVPFLRAIRRKMGNSVPKLSDLRSTAFVNAIDWNHTKVFFGMDGGLRINLRGREPQGIVSPGSEYEALRHQLRQELESLVDQFTGQRVVSSAIFREEIYDGPYVELAPDIVIEPHREQPDFTHNYILDGSLRSSLTPIFDSSAPYSGNHAPNGILCAWGPGVRVGAMIEGAKIIDIAPTILGAMGCIVPSQMDGQVLDIFTPPISTQKSAEEFNTQNENSQIYSEKEADLVQQRLRDLGYL